jgi:hypothetical protein
MVIKDMIQKPAASSCIIVTDAILPTTLMKFGLGYLRETASYATMSSHKAAMITILISHFDLSAVASSQLHFMFLEKTTDSLNDIHVN